MAKKSKAPKKEQETIDSFRTNLAKESFQDNMDKAIQWVMSRKEEIIIAFIAKYGVEPEMIEIKSSHGDEATWSLRKKERTAWEITAKEITDWMDQKDGSWKASSLDVKAAALAIQKGVSPLSGEKKA